MRRALLCLVFVFAAPITAQAQQPRALDVLSIYRDLNAMCRDPSSDDLHKIAACNTREKVSRLLNGLGYCHGSKGEDVADLQWHKCTEHELF